MRPYRSVASSLQFSHLRNRAEKCLTWKTFSLADSTSIATLFAGKENNIMDIDAEDTPARHRELAVAAPDICYRKAM
jgi:hypothetical protein